MKTGQLNFINSQWVITFVEEFGPNSVQLKRILVNPIDVNEKFSEGKQVNFKIVKGFPKIQELKNSINPVISDDFQIGPYGAYEHTEDVLTWGKVFDELDNLVHEKLPMRVKYWFENKFEPPILKKKYENQ